MTDTQKAPAPACFIKGEPWWNFTFTYRFDGAEYGFDVCARSEAEAHARLKCIALARYDGQMDGRPVPIWRGGFLLPLKAWWRNLGRAAQ